MPVQAGITSSSAAEGYLCDAKRLDSRIALTMRACAISSAERNGTQWKPLSPGGSPAPATHRRPATSW